MKKFFLFLCLALYTPAQAATVSADVAWPVSGNTLARAKDAFTFASRSNWNEAMGHANRSGDPVVKKIVQWKYYSSGQYRSFSEIAAFIDQNPKWPDVQNLQRQAETWLDDSVPLNQLAQWFAKHPPLTAKGMQYAAEAQIAKTGQNNAAKALLRKAWVDGNFSAPDEKSFLSRHSNALTRTDHHARIARLLWNDRIDQAVRIMYLSDDAHKKLFLARIALKRNAPGVNYAIANVPSSLVNDEGLIYDRLKWRQRNGDVAGMRQLLAQVPVRSGYPDAWWSIKQAQIRGMVAERQYRAAYTMAANHGLSSGENFADGEWLAGWISLRFLNDPKTAYKHFYALYTKVQYPVSLARAAYWAGRAAEADKKPKIATDWYLVAANHIQTFYGQLALAKLNKNATLTSAEASRPTAADKNRVLKNELAKALYLLVMTGQNDGMTRLFTTQAVAAARTSGEKELIGNMLFSRNRYDLAVVASKQAAKEGVLLAYSGYPLMREVTGTPEERCHNLAVIRQESEFRKNAQSPVGATGYMQLMPATAQMVSKELKLPYSASRLSNDGAFNIRLGSHYLQKLKRGFGGSYILSIAAYNAGPGNVRKWIAQNGRLQDQRNVEDVVDWIERIPFAETRNYVHRVLENVQVYEMLVQTKRRNMEDLLMHDEDIGVQEAGRGGAM